MLCTESLPMTFQPRLTPEREEELIDEYHYGNCSINDISVIFRISIRTVYRILDKHNVRTKTMNEGERQAVVRDYRDRGISITDLSFIYKVSRKQIYRILEKYEVELVNDGRKTLQKPQKRLLRALPP